MAWATDPVSPAQLALAVLAGIALPPANAFMRTLWARAYRSPTKCGTPPTCGRRLSPSCIIGAPLISPVS
ncbi:hypothetical protein E4K10_46225 [Streptomyces sp. T1317-0309]|nr:hypothetical protein E4K10_46225 [Streptomyces sp. T1317-0309]